MANALTGLLLAAGRARRFGANKILARLPQGLSIGVCAARVIAGAVDELTVVIRAGDEATRDAFSAASFDLIECADADRGMAHSLRCGVMYKKDADAWLVALGDMPYLDPPTVDALVDSFKETDAIVVPRCDGQAGHPVIFPARFYSDLVGLSGDTGARAVIDAHPADVVWVDTQDRGVLRDIDVPEDL